MPTHYDMPFCKPDIKVLLYHRVDTIDTDPWGITVSPHHLEEQVRFLKDHCNVISADELITQITTGTITQNSICMTFDDGYADNYIYAKPILERYACPATFFIPTAFTGSTIAFWWEELEMIFLRAKELPAQLLLPVADNYYNYTIGETELTKEQILQHAKWKWYEEPPTSRCAVFLDIWNNIKPLPPDAIIEQMDAIKNWANITESISPNRLAMSEHQVQQLLKNKLFTIAMHTHTHPDLDGKQFNFQLAEIMACKKALYSKYNVDSNLLSYPYGRYDENTLQAFNHLNIHAAFTTQAASIDAHTNRALLGRFQVFDHNAQEFKQYFNL